MADSIGELWCLEEGVEWVRLLPETCRLLFSKLEERPKENIQNETWGKKTKIENIH